MENNEHTSVPASPFDQAWTNYASTQAYSELVGYLKYKNSLGATNLINIMEELFKTGYEHNTDFQDRLMKWAYTCFDREFVDNPIIRRGACAEEMFEVLQAAKMPLDDLIDLARYVYARPVGDLPQEIGGLITVLASLSQSHQIDMQKEAEKELARMWTKIDVIREKQKTKPHLSVGHSRPFPDVLPPSQENIDTMTEIVDQLNYDLDLTLARTVFLETPSLQELKTPLEESQPKNESLVDGKWVYDDGQSPPIVIHPQQERHGDLFILHYEDKDIRPEFFEGEGAETAAKLRYAQQLNGWNCHLLQKITLTRP